MESRKDALHQHTQEECRVVQDVVAPRAYVEHEADVHMQEEVSSSQAQTSKKTVLGIELGNTSSYVATLSGDNEPCMVKFDGHVNLPAGLDFSNNLVQIGVPCNDANTIKGFISLLGKKYMYAEKCVSSNAKLMPAYVNMVDVNGYPMIRVTQKGEIPEMAAEELTALYLRKMSKEGGDVDSTYISVPSHLSMPEKHAVLQAANIAQLKDVHIVNTTSAAAVAYAHLNKMRPEMETIFVLDIGSRGTCAAVIDVNQHHVKVRNTEGSHVGGESFDKNIVKLMLTNQHQGDMPNNLFKNIKNQAEHVKVRLNTNSQAYVHVGIGNNKSPNKILITQEKFNSKNRKLYARIQEAIEKSVDAAKLHGLKISKVIITGGTSKIPKIQTMLKNIFKTSHLVEISKERIAMGLAVYEKYQVEESAMSIIVANSYDLQETVVFPKNTSLPACISPNLKNVYYCIGEILGDRKIPLLKLEVENHPVQFSIDKNMILNIKYNNTKINIFNEINLKTNIEKVNKLFTQSEKDRVEAASELAKFNLECETFSANCDQALKFLTQCMKFYKDCKYTTEQAKKWVKSNPSAGTFQIECKRQKWSEDVKNVGDVISEQCTSFESNTQQLREKFTQ